MKKSKALILGAVGLLIIGLCFVSFSRFREKKDEYSYELLRVEASLEQIVQYSDSCIDAILLGEKDWADEKHGYLMQAVSELNRAVTNIKLLFDAHTLSSEQIYKLSDHLNGSYPNLSDDTKLYWLESIRDASKNFLSGLGQTKELSINDFTELVNEFSSALPTYE